MGIPCALSVRQRFPPCGSSKMAAYSAQRASHERETHRLRVDLRQSRIHHGRGQAEHTQRGDNRHWHGIEVAALLDDAVEDGKVNPTQAEA